MSIDWDSMSEMSSVCEDSISVGDGREGRGGGGVGGKGGGGFLKSRSVLQEKKNMIRRVMGGEREREREVSADYWRDLTHLEERGNAERDPPGTTRREIARDTGERTERIMDNISEMVVTE